jgi:hypothetical protein
LTKHLKFSSLDTGHSLSSDVDLFTLESPLGKIRKSKKNSVLNDSVAEKVVLCDFEEKTVFDKQVKHQIYLHLY